MERRPPLPSVRATTAQTPDKIIDPRLLIHVRKETPSFLGRPRRRGRDWMIAVAAPPKVAFTQSDMPPPHRQRAREILAAHPVVRRLFKRDRWSALWTVLLVALQVAIGIGLALLD